MLQGLIESYVALTVLVLEMSALFSLSECVGVYRGRKIKRG